MLQQLEMAQRTFQRKIIVLDDDPTGIQTVHGVPVYTDWEEDTFVKALEAKESLVFILTNSRSFSREKTAKVHKELAINLEAASRKTKKEYLLISRGDSTMRGHYPLETEVLKDCLEELTKRSYDGEVIFPFFLEGGRVTIDNIHYVKEKEKLVPIGETEFSKDVSFGYSSSDLTKWCEEKTKGNYLADQMICITREDLDQAQKQKPFAAGIIKKLMQVSGFQKIIVNATSYLDVEIFTVALFAAIENGKEFLFRTAASFLKVIGGISDRPFLTAEELVDPANLYGGIVLVGSHVKKTTQQLDVLKKSKKNLLFLEFNVSCVWEEGGLEAETKRMVEEAEKRMKQGTTVVLYTSRLQLYSGTRDRDQDLALSVKISEAVTSIIGKLSIKPRFILAKGGITSSDVGTKALLVKQALVMGQMQKGVAVWMTGEESKFPKMPYIIFPGNVGDSFTLCQVVEELMKDISNHK